MIQRDVELLVARFETAFRQLAAADLVNEWARALHRADVADAATAADRVIDEEKFFPSVATFRRYLDATARATPKPAEARCAQCDGSRWINGPEATGVAFPTQRYETVRPCEICAPVAYEQWRACWIPETRRHHRPDDTLYEVHPDVAKARARELRGFLAEVPDLLKNPDDLDDRPHRNQGEAA